MKEEKKELESFFNKVVVKKDESNFNDILFIAVNEWHIDPRIILEIELPMLFDLLEKRNKYIDECERRMKTK